MNVGFDNDKEISIDSYDLEKLANLENVKHIKLMTWHCDNVIR